MGAEPGVELRRLWCSECGRRTTFDAPCVEEQPDGGGPELACTRCGAAIILGLHEPIRTRRRPAVRHAA